MRCVHFPVPVVREPQKLKLLSEPFYISLRSNPGMGTGSDGVLLCWKTESVPPDRAQNVESLHPLVSGNDIRCCIPLRVASVETRSSWGLQKMEGIMIWLTR